jgi:ComF family protein
MALYGKPGSVELWGRFLLQLLYPQYCLCCGDPLLFRSDLRHPICTNCRARLEPLAAGDRCEICSAPLISEVQRCTRCSGLSFTFRRNFSLFEYRGNVRRIISQFKFSNRRSAAPLIAHLMAPALRRVYPGLPVVPVPGSRRSVRRRGWDPMVEVARELRRAGQAEVLPLLRRYGGGAQKGLHYKDRMANIRGTIRLRNRRRIMARVPRTVVLLDDIFTSGATADECARILVQAGAEEVDVLTLAMEL